MPFRDYHQEILKKKKKRFITYKKLYSPPQATEQGHGGERGSALAWGSAFIGTQGFVGSIFFGEFKTYEWEFKGWEEKKHMAQMVTYWIQYI